MSTDEFEPCCFCKASTVTERGDALALWAECMLCRARGPAVVKTRPDASAQVVAAWNAGRNFGRLAAGHVSGGLSSKAAAIALWLQLQGERVMAGECGNPDAVVLLLRTNNTVVCSLNGLGNADAAALMQAIIDSSRVRAVALPTSGRN